MKRRDGIPSLRELARIARVSPSTVSRALAGKEGVSEATRARLLELAHEMGLAPRDGAGVDAARRGRNEHHTGLRGTIAATLIVDARSNPIMAELDSEPFYMELVAGLYEGGSRYRADLSLMSVTTDEDVDHAVARATDGVIWLGYHRAEGYSPWVAQLKARGIPVILCDHYVADLACDAVLSDNVGGAYQAAQYLAQLGHRKVSILGQDLPSVAAIERTRGAVAGLVQGGLSPHDIQVVVAAPSFDGGYAALDQVLAFGATAVLCGNDMMALGVIRRAAERGVSVPGALSVVGFDDISMSAKVTPALTTVHVDKRLLGMETVRRLLHCIVERDMGLLTPEAFDRSSVRTLVPTRLVCRETTAAPPVA